MARARTAVDLTKSRVPRARSGANGLIAEEVAKVYPQLVIRDQGGELQGVRYDELAPILLKQIQSPDAEIAARRQLSDVDDLKARLAALENAALSAAASARPNVTRLE